jgi:hypothetical protein
MGAIREKGLLVSLTVDEPSRAEDRRPPLVTRLSLVVHIGDSLFPAGRPMGPVRVSLLPGGQGPIYNLSGAPCFLDLPAGTYQLVVEGEHYFPESQSVTLPLGDPLHPLLEVQLMPLPSYPFPPGTTVVRGMVHEDPDTPVAGAGVEVPGEGVRTRTTNRGEFALAWPPLPPSRVIVERQDGVTRRYVQNDHGEKELRVEITHPDYRQEVVTITELEEGTMLNLGSITVTR